jgi:predicted nucleic acid-binding protein
LIWVVDASVALRWLLDEERHPDADAVLERMIASPERFAVPELFCFEVHAVLVRLHPAGGRAFVDGVLPVLQAGILRHPMTAELAAACEPYIRDGLTGYDACYAALAGLLQGLWLTFDAQAHARVAGRGVAHLLSDGLPRDL